METGRHEAVEPEPYVKPATKAVTYPPLADQEAEDEQPDEERLRDQPEGVNLERHNSVTDYTAGPIYDL
ncbi:MAG: hypothetical protein ACOYU7_00385 [Bacillota bacterium]